MRNSIEDILISDGMARSRRLNAFLKDCTDQEKALLLFVGTNPNELQDGQMLTEAEKKKINDAVKDKKAFNRYTDLTNEMRDIWLRTFAEMQACSKALFYLTACAIKIDDAIGATSVCNKALACIPVEARAELGNSMMAALDKGESIIMEGDVFSVGFYYDAEQNLMLADVEDVEIVMKDGIAFLVEKLSIIKAVASSLWDFISKVDVFKDYADYCLRSFWDNVSVYSTDGWFSVYSATKRLEGTNHPTLPCWEDVKADMGTYTLIKNELQVCLKGNK